MKQVSAKKAKRNREYKKACEEIKEEREQECQGCGTAERLSFSHLEPRSFSTVNEANKEMIHIHCMSFGEIEGCHDKYEDHRFSELNDEESIIEALLKYAPDYLKLIESKIK